MQRVLIFGASGYTGLELLRWLALHPAAHVAGASSDRWAGEAVTRRAAIAPHGLVFSTHAATLALVRADDVAFLATPAETSLSLAAELLSRGARVIDLSGAFRLASTEDYPPWYRFTHDRPDLLREAAYGLPELMPVPPGSRLVSNPGCYATAAALAVAPLIALAAPGAPIVLDGKSGTTGAGRKADEALSFSEVADTVRPYRVLAHQHTPEIERCLSLSSKTAVQVSFTPHLVPLRRGLIVSAYLRARDGVTQEDVSRVMSQTYAAAPFVRICSDRPPEPAGLQHSNLCEVGAWIDPRTGVIAAFGALDNLVKGAAGQAIQNFNRICGLDETAGLLAPVGAAN